MPEQPPDPLVTADLLATIAIYGWQNNHLIDTNGAPKYLGTTGANPRTWVIADTGAHLSQATRDMLASGTANSNGSFNDANGNRYHLNSSYSVLTGITTATPVLVT